MTKLLRGMAFAALALVALAFGSAGTALAVACVCNICDVAANGPNFQWDGILGCYDVQLSGSGSVATGTGTSAPGGPNLFVATYITWPDNSTSTLSSSTWNYDLDCGLSCSDTAHTIQYWCALGATQQFEYAQNYAKVTVSSVQYRSSSTLNVQVPY